VGLFVDGADLSGLGPMLAIVGSRAATPRGRLFAREISASLASAGLAIVSGLARGIDTAAHEGALDAGAVTVAVLGSGLDRVYPRENDDLARRITRRGAVVTEFPFGTEPRAEHFPMRNRIVSGLSAGVLVVEAGERSGALITAAMALEEGREVFAVPGSPDDPGARGPNGLIRGGAKLVERAADVFEEIEAAWGPFGRTEAPAAVPSVSGETPPGASPAGTRALLGREPASPEAIAAQLGVPVQTVLEELIELELAGLARSWPGGRYTRA
jgi:DNA processing protein